MTTSPSSSGRPAILPHCEQRDSVGKVKTSSASTNATTTPYLADTLSAAYRMGGQSSDPGANPWSACLNAVMTTASSNDSAAVMMQISGCSFGCLSWHTK